MKLRDWLATPAMCFANMQLRHWVMLSLLCASAAAGVGLAMWPSQPCEHFEVRKHMVRYDSKWGSGVREQIYRVCLDKEAAE